jgi:hypothetical protein
MRTRYCDACLARKRSRVAIELAEQRVSGL